MKRYARLFCLLAAASLAGACAPMANGEMAYLYKEVGASMPWNKDKPDLNEYYPQAAWDMAADLDAQLASRLGFDHTTTRGLQWVIVSTPSELSRMGKASPLSRALAEQLGTALTARGYYVQEIRKTSEVVFDRNQGEFMLSRDVRQHATRAFKSTLVVTGTYSPSPAGVRFTIEAVDARNNDVLAKTTRLIPMSRTVAVMLEDDTPARGAIRPTVATIPGAPEPGPSYLPPGDWRTSRQKWPNFLLP